MSRLQPSDCENSSSRLLNSLALNSDSLIILLLFKHFMVDLGSLWQLSLLGPACGYCFMFFMLLKPVVIIYYKVK